MRKSQQAHIGDAVRGSIMPDGPGHPPIAIAGFVTDIRAPYAAVAVVGFGALQWVPLSTLSVVKREAMLEPFAAVLTETTNG
jgi:hypothetical protein